MIKLKTVGSTAIVTVGDVPFTFDTLHDAFTFIKYARFPF